MTTNQTSKNDSTRVIDLNGKEIKELISEAVRNEFNELKSMLNLPSPKIDKYLTRKEAASNLKITLPTLRVWTKSGKLKAYQIGRRVLYRAEQVDQALHAQLVFVRK